MTTSPTIESLEQLLLSKCYYYAYIDDNGLRGTIDMSEFKQGKPVTKYYSEENGVKSEVGDSKWEVEHLINFRRKPEDRISVKQVQLPTLQLYDADERSSFVQGIGLRILYLLKDKGVIDSNSDKEVIGTVVSNNNSGNNKIQYDLFKNLSNKKQRLTGGAGPQTTRPATRPANRPATRPVIRPATRPANPPANRPANRPPSLGVGSYESEPESELESELESEPEPEPESQSESDTENATDEYQVYINNVDIDSDSQGKRLCKIMVQLFLLNANASAGENLSYWLTNAGGQISCRCYTNAFKECGYKVFGYIEEPHGRDEITTKKEMTVDLCKTIYSDPDDDGDHIQMGFVYSGVSGGKRSGSKLKNRKTKKSKKNKTRKSRKNKTRKTRTIKKTRKTRKTRKNKK